MVEWLAILVICLNNECAFWADTKIPYATQEQCAAKVITMAQHFESKKIEVPLVTCIPLTFTKSQI
jgi:hypothetical protein